MSWDIFSKSKIQYFLQKLKAIFDKKLQDTTLASNGETEATTTATMAHAKDSKFYLAATGEYCMAKTAIAIGDTLAKDTNYVVISVNGFLTDMETYLKLAGQMLVEKLNNVNLTDIIETGVTSSRAYNQYDRFYRNDTGEYCVASTNIAIGDTFVKDTNYILATIDDLIQTLITYKVDKEVGKGLSTNDYTTAEKQKLASIPVWTVNETTHKIVLSEYADGNDISY